MQPSFVLNTKNMTEGDSYGLRNYSIDRTYIYADRRISELALQQKLGLQTQWRTGLSGRYPFDPCVDGPNLKKR